MSTDSEKLLATVIDFCHRNLREDEETWEYVTKVRKLSEKTINELKIGAFPVKEQTAGQLYSLIRRMDSPVLGHIMRTNDNFLESTFFHNRLIFPINDCFGAPQAIMGRVLVDELECKTLGYEKYYNSPYPKRANLFGLDWARRTALRTGELIMVEGNMDAIAAYDHGIKNVVATSHAFASYKQICQAARYAKRIFVCFDNDEAGLEGRERVFKKFGKALPEPLGIELIPMAVPSSFKDMDAWLTSGAK